MKSSKQIQQSAKHLLRLCYADGLLDAGRAERLVQRVLKAKPRGYLPVLAQFRRLVELERARHAARIETATPLSPELAAKVQDRLTRAYGSGLSFSFLHNPALIGGMRITVGSDVYDGSIQGRLAALEERFCPFDL